MNPIIKRLCKLNILKLGLEKKKNFSYFHFLVFLPNKYLKKYRFGKYTLNFVYYFISFDIKYFYLIKNTIIRVNC
jgi:hypothetical protein